MCFVDLSGVNGRIEPVSSSTGEQHLSSSDEGDDYSQAAKHEESPLLRSAPSDPPAAISRSAVRRESLPSGAADDGPQSVELAGHNLDSPVSVDINDDDDHQDDVGNGHDGDDDDDRQQQTDESDGEIYQLAAARVSSTANSPDDSAAETLSNLYSMAAASEPVALDSLSTFGDRYSQAQPLLDAAVDFSAVSGMADSNSLPEDTDESAAIADGCQTPDSDSGYCSVKFSMNAMEDKLSD